jgi:hypothetical protein
MLRLVRGSSYARVWVDYALFSLAGVLLVILEAQAGFPFVIM